MPIRTITVTFKLTTIFHRPEIVLRVRAIVLFVLVSVAFLVWQGCGLTEPEDTPSPDLPPEQISDVEIVERALTSVTLTWTAPGGGGIDSIASAYDIRYSTYRYLYLEGHWDSASQVDDEPIPQPAGNQETYVVRNLNPSTEYYFSIKAASKHGNWSEASISEKATTLPEISTWMRTYDDYGPIISVLSTPDGGYVCTGSTRLSDGGQKDIYVFKVDDSGNIEWQRTYGGDLDDVVDCMVAAQNGGFVIAGRIMESSPCYHDVFWLKIDASGNPIREQIFEDIGSCMPFSIEAIPGGGYILAGGTFSFGSSGERALLIKVNTAGDLIWQNSYGDHATSARSITTADNGDYIFVGKPGQITRVSPSGVPIWERTVTDPLVNIVTTPHGSFVLFGWASGSIYMTEIDGSGNQIWQKRTYVKLASWRPPIPTPDGDYIIVGNYLTGAFLSRRSHITILKVSSIGDLVWNTYPGVIGTWIISYSIIGKAYAIERTSDGGYLISGGEGENANDVNNSDALLMKVDGNGHISLDGT